MSQTHIPQNWIQKLCVLLSIDGWLHGTFPHEVVRFFTAWAQAEGGKAEWDPLNTTTHITEDGEAWQGADYNGVHVTDFTSPFHGIVGTAATLMNGHYPNILTLLRAAPVSGIHAEEIVQQCSDEIKTWGTNPKTILEVLATIK